MCKGNSAGASTGARRGSGNSGTACPAQGGRTRTIANVRGMRANRSRKRRPGATAGPGLAFVTLAAATRVHKRRWPRWRCRRDPARRQRGGRGPLRSRLPQPSGPLRGPELRRTLICLLAICPQANGRVPRQLQCPDSDGQERDGSVLCIRTAILHVVQRVRIAFDAMPPYVFCRKCPQDRFFGFVTVAMVWSPIDMKMRHEDPSPFKLRGTSIVRLAIPALSEAEGDESVRSPFGPRPPPALRIASHRRGRRRRPFDRNRPGDSSRVNRPGNAATIHPRGG